MNRAAGFYKKDWFVVLLLGLAFAIAILIGSPALQRLESLVYDAGVRMTSRAPGASENIAIVAIDDASIQEIGHWPWPRSVLAEVVDQLVRARAKVIGLLIPLNEPQTDPGLGHIQRLRSYLNANPLPKHLKQGKEISRLLAEAEYRLDTDPLLAKAISPGNHVFLPMDFVSGQPLGKPDAPLPEYMRRNRLTKVDTTGGADAAAPTIAAHLPLEMFARKAAGIGHLNIVGEPSQGVRGENLVLEHYGEYYPSLSLLIAAHSLNLRPGNVKVELGRGVRLGQLDIRTDEHMRMYTGFYPARNDESPFALHSFRDVRAARVPASAFRNKIVLIGTTAPVVSDPHATPLGPMSGPEVTANVVASILNQDFYQRAPWAPWVEGALFAAVLLYLMFLMPRLPARHALSLSAVLLIVLIVAGHYLLLSEKLWLKTATPALFLVLGHGLIGARSLFLSKRLATEAETDSAQTNRMLGLAFQGQGQLDMALDKFRKLPVDGSVLELFFNLALDFERKRQFSKAAACYECILDHNAKFRDAAARKQRAVAAEQTVMLGGAPANAGGTLVLNAIEKPRLGRYEVEKELGRGAMGTVYLGRDPRINRVVAIKTVALSQFEEAELAQVRERFFREAETAGRLNHPNIVTIYDAGEEHDLGYIAMEFLEGKDLAHYVQTDKQLALDWVANVVAQVADALGYAHQHDVVHRDVKPANIMYDEAKKSVKVTDFGIARITASTRTRTGTIMGSPSYMSPEQLAGKRVDGRSDIFSLGVMLFELLTKTQPFQGDSMATLMFQIANEPHPDILAIRPELPPRIRTLINKALQKNPDKRFQTAAEFRDALLAFARVVPA